MASSILVRFITCLLILLCIGIKLGAQSTASDCNSCDGTYTIDIAGGDLVIWYFDGLELGQQTNPANTIDLNDLCVGQYTYEIHLLGVLIEIGSFNVAVPSLNPGSNQTIFECESLTDIDLNALLSIGADGGGDWTYEGQIIGNMISAESASSGLYEYTLSDALCTVSSVIDLQINPVPFPGLTTTHLICENYLPFSMIDQLQGDIILGEPQPGGYWTDELDNPMDGIYYPGTGMEGAYQYTIDNVPGCGPVTSVLIVVEVDLPNPGTYTDLWVCEGSAPFDLIDFMEGNPDLGGVWYSTSNLQFDGVFDPASMPEGEYRYRVNGSSVCPQQQEFLNVHLTPGLDAGLPASIGLCDTDAPISLYDELGGTPDPFGTWTYLGAETDDQFDPSIGAVGEYLYTVEGAGCPLTTTSITIAIEDGPVAGQDIAIAVCNTEGNVNLNGLLTNDVDAGMWFDEAGNGPLTNATYLNEPLDEYTFVVTTDACGTDEATLVIAWDTDPEVEVLTEQICATEAIEELMSFIQVAGTPEVVFTDMATGLVADNINVAVEGTYNYEVEVDPQNACAPSTFPLTIDVVSNDWEDQSIDRTFCDSVMEISLNDIQSGYPDGGTWTDDEGEIVEGSVPVASAPIELTYSYQQFPVCPVVELLVGIEVIVTPNAGADVSQVLCDNVEQIDLADYLDDGDEGGTWYLDGLIIDALLTAADIASNEFVYEIPGSGDCPTDQATISLLVLPTPEVSLGNDFEVCFSDTPLQLAVEEQPEVSYLWTGHASLEGESTSAVMFVPSPEDIGNVEIGVEASNDGCVISDELAINLLPSTPIVLDEVIMICAGETATLNINPEFNSIEWSPVALFDNPAAAEANFMPLDDIEVQVEAVNDAGCVSTAVAWVDVLEVPEAAIVSDQLSGCEPLSFLLEVQSDAELGVVSWLLNGNLIAQGNTISAQDIMAGEYTYEMVVEGQNGCRADTLMTTVEVYDQPDAGFQFSPDAVTPWNTQIAFEPNFIDEGDYFWYFGDFGQSTESHPVVDFEALEDQFTEVCLLVVTPQGCQNQACSYINEEDEILVFVPSAFTPDNDGLNEVFRPEISQEVANYEFRIYDRWGKMIFVSNDPSDGWIGNVIGGNHYVSPGIYSWSLTFNSLGRQSPEEHRGLVTVIR